MSRRSLIAAIAVVLIIFLAGAVRLFTLPQEAVDGDELFSRRIALLPIGQMLPAVAADLVHPPLYYILLKAGMTVWGGSALGIRAWSLFSGLLVIPFAWYIGRKIGGGSYLGLLAAAMLALNPTLIFYSQQARSYILYVLLTVLLWIWASAIRENADLKFRFWIAGYILMAALVYTHYVAALFVGATVLGIVASNLPSRTKISVLVTSGMAALSFVPWILRILPVYRQKHGIGSNLDWQGHPSFYDLKAIWASSIGIVDVRGATTITFSIAILLISSAFIVAETRKHLRTSPLLMALMFCAALPPLALFIASKDPIGLPLFGLRHVLPSIVATVVCCLFALDRLCLSFCGRFSSSAFALSVSILLLIASFSTVSAIAHSPMREPYNKIAPQVEAFGRSGQKIYTTWPYGIGAPVNFYCTNQCVDELPTNYNSLPGSFYLLYRPNMASERMRYQSVISSGFTAFPRAYVADGRNSAWGTQMTLLVRNGK